MNLKESLQSSEFGAPFKCDGWRLPEGTKLTIRALTKPERDWLATAIPKSPEERDAMPKDVQDQRGMKMIAMFLGDENGNRIFSDEETEAIAKIPIPAQARILNAGLNLNSIGSLEEEKKS